MPQGQPGCTGRYVTLYLSADRLARLRAVGLDPAAALRSLIDAVPIPGTVQPSAVPASIPGPAPQPARSAGRLCPRCTRIGRPAPACPQCAALAADA